MNMKNKIKWFWVLLIFPAIAMAQEAVSLTGNTPFLRTRQFFYLNIGWPLVSLILVSFCTSLALIIVRKKHKQSKATWIISVFLAFGVWYFYPVFTFKGTYIAPVGNRIEATRIDKTYHLLDGENDLSSGLELPYTLKPFHRMLLVEFKIQNANTEYVPIKLGWNKIHQPVIKEGLVEFKKVN
jgi:hypothetical protein